MCRIVPVDSEIDSAPGAERRYNRGMNRISALVATSFTAVIAASCTAAPVAVAAGSPYCDRTSWMYDADLCAQVGDRTPGGGPTLVPTTTTTTPSTGNHNSITGAIDGVLPWIIAIAVVALIIAIVRSVARDRQKESAQQQAAELNRGRRIAQDAGAAPDAQSPEDLQRYHAFGWAVPWQPGTAFGNLVDRRGSYPRLNAAWTEACELARLGHWDESGAFTPAATVANVNGYSDATGDLELFVNTADYTVGARELNRVLEHLVRTARVETASDFARDAVRDWHVTRLSMNPEQSAPAAVPQEDQQPVPDPAAGWEW